MQSCGSEGKISLLSKIKIMNKIILFFLIIFVTFSCKNNNNIIKEYYSDGMLKEKYIMKDSLLHGFYEKYYRNGNVFIKCNYENGLRQGEYFEYYKSGELKAKANFNNGIYDTLISFYKNGAIEMKKIKNVKQKKIIVYEYFENGELRSYLISRNIHDGFFKRNYNKNNNEIKDEGTIVGMVKLIEDSIFVNDSVTFYILMARPPNCMYYCTAQITPRYQEYHMKEKDNICSFTCCFDSVGTYEFLIRASLKDTLRDTIVTEAYPFNIEVFPQQNLHQNKIKSINIDT